MKTSFKLNLSLRILIPLATVLIATSLLFVTVLYDRAWQIKVLPQIFTEEPMTFDQLVETTNLQANLSEKDLIHEMLLRTYVEDRHTFVPDIGYLNYRYGKRGRIAQMSTPAIFRKFVASKGNYLEGIKTKTNTSTVDIVEYLHRDRDTYQIDFDIYNYNQGHVARGGRKRAIIKVGYKPNCARYRKDFANPYCLVVLSYDETSLKK